MSNTVKEKITADDWKQIEEILKSFFKSVKLNCDGYEITLVLRQLTTFSNAIVVYVNGKFEFQWLMEDCEERRRFCCPSTRSILNKESKKAWSKLLTKKEMKEKEKNSMYTNYRSYWTSFRSLKRHLIANNEVIQWIVDDKEE